jgi:microcystin-dependent protein
MATPYLSEIKLVAFNYAPQGWALCNGQLLGILQNQALFSCIGTTYGGNGVETFALPNLQGSAPMSMGNGYDEGQTGGEAQVTLNINQIPAHAHQAQGVSTTANLEPAAGNAWAASTDNPYAASANTTMSAGAAGQAGGSQPHNNLPPYLVLNFIIALAGIFPSRN